MEGIVSTRIIMHADLDAFYAQVEQVRNGTISEQNIQTCAFFGNKHVYWKVYHEISL